MSTLPDAIQALVTAEKKTISLVQIPFATTDKVRNLPPHEVVVRVRAVGLNPTDYKHAYGIHAKTAGLVCGCDAAGDVFKVGSSVKGIQVGDRVAGFLRGSTLEDNGSFAEYVRYDSAVLLKLPSDMTYEEAASFPIPHYTAVQALYMRFGLPYPSKPAAKKDIVLIWGGSTAVGHHAIQLAHLSGLRVFVTASPSTHEVLKALGAEACFDYKDSDVAQKIKDSAGQPGITMALDTISERGTTTTVVDAIGPFGGQVITLLWPSEESIKRRADVKVTYMVVYSELGDVLRIWDRVIDAKPEDRAAIKYYLNNELPSLLEGWKAGSGSPKFQTQKLRGIPGGFQGILDGLQILQKGEYAREKLVVNLP